MVAFTLEKAFHHEGHEEFPDSHVGAMGARKIRRRSVRQRTPCIRPCRLYDSIHAAKAFAEHPDASIR